MGMVLVCRIWILEFLINLIKIGKGICRWKRLLFKLIRYFEIWCILIKLLLRSVFKVGRLFFVSLLL